MEKLPIYRHDLSFGSRSAPKFFNAVADSLMWIMEFRGIAPALRYLDDFLLFWASKVRDMFTGTRASPGVLHSAGDADCSKENRRSIHSACILRPLIGQSGRYSTTPEEKLHRLQAQTTTWANKKSCTKRELLSLIGQLQHASCAGRSFLRRMISLSTKPKELDHYVRLNKEFQSDLHWWTTFLPSWHGKGMFKAVVRSPWVAAITFDVSGNMGLRSIHRDKTVVPIKMV